MFFNDGFGKRKVNMGDISLTSKDDFLKKMKDEEEKEKNKKKVDNAMSIIKKFVNKNFVSSSEDFKSSKLIHNLTSLIELIKKSNFNKEKNQKLAILSIQKVSDELLNMLNCRSLSNTILFSLVRTISDVLSYTDSDSVKNLLSGNEALKYTKIFYKLIKGSIYELYFNTKKDYLINEKYSVFAYLYYLNFVFPKNTKNSIYQILSHNISFIYILIKILNKQKLILAEYSKEIFFDFCGNISNIIIADRRKKNNKYKFHPLIYKFLEVLLNNYIYNCINGDKTNRNVINDKKNNNFSNTSINAFDLLCNLEESSLSFLDNFQSQNVLNIFEYISSEIEIKIKNNEYLNNGDYLHIFIQIFKKLSELNLTGYDNAIFLSKISNILEYIFISYQMKLDNNIKSNNNENNSFIEYLSKEENINETKNIIKVIFNSTKVIENLYLSNSEKRNCQMIYDYIINKIVIKYCHKIIDILLYYTVNQLKIIYPKIATLEAKNNPNSIKFYNNNKIILLRKESKEEVIENENIFEVISFIVLNQINYKSNFFFVEFKTTKNIYENLPFNYLFLNMFSKYLITLFTQIIAKTNFEDLNNISENMIILCLKGLYLLDGDINFTPNREEFWNNMELVSKITGTSKSLLLEKIKLIPFIFPLKTRLKIGVSEIKRLKEERRNSIRNMRNQNELYNYFGEEFMDDDRDNVHIKIPRESIFNSTFMYYMQNLLSPYRKWIVTFIDKLGQVEQGVDAGGLYKEFMYKLSEEAFSSKLGYFEESQIGLILPTRDALHANKDYNYSSAYEFLGFIVAKAITDDIKIYPNFSPVFLNNILEIENSFIDLKTYDPELYKNLVTLKTYEGDVENDLGLSFSLTIEEDGKIKNFDLIENGNNIPVTNSNRLIYIKKVTDYYLTYQFKDAVQNFRNGMSKVINMDILRLYTGEELRQIIYGFDKDVFDVRDMQANSNFVGFNMNDPADSQCINDFFKILDEFSQKEKEKFLFFCTSLKRLPIGGFVKMNPKFTVAKAHIEVPTSSTCVNMLKLPILPYQKLKEILLYVINADAGFYYA